jgi:hypothetical protein
MVREIRNAYPGNHGKLESRVRSKVQARFGEGRRVKGLPRYHQEAQRSSWQVGEAEDLAGRLLYSNRGPVVSV